MPEHPDPPEFLVDVIERRFGLAPYVTAAVWERMLDEGELTTVRGTDCPLYRVELEELIDA